MVSRVYDWIVLKFISNITWTGLKRFFTGRDFNLTLQDRRDVSQILYHNNCLCLTRRDSHLTTYLIAIGEFFLRGKWGFWSHALFNIESSVEFLYQIKLIEAISKGVIENDVVEVLNVDAIVLLVPYMYGTDEKLTLAWDAAVQGTSESLGTGYDTHMNIKDPTKVSCVELILCRLKHIEGYETHFSGLLKMIEKEKNLTPDMLYDCGDFKTLLEIRR